jgi:bilirubin oxidase
MEPGQYKDYYYPNALPRTLWYHDHAHRASVQNMLSGMVGLYQISDSKRDRSLGLPFGKYDIPLILTSHFFTPSGGIKDSSEERNSVYGDTFLVNGQIQPFLNVEPRKYRFRLLNAAVSRVFNLTMEGGTIPMSVIGSDGGLRPSPARTKSLVIGMAERWEVVIDFAPYAGRNLILKTTNMWTDTTYSQSMNQLLQFRISEAVSDSSNNGPLPTRLVNIHFPSKAVKATERTFTLDSHMDMTWSINFKTEGSLLSHVLMNPPLGTIEKINFKSDGMGGMSGMGGMGGMMSGMMGDMGSMMSGMMGGMSMRRMMEGRGTKAKRLVNWLFSGRKEKRQGMMMGSGSWTHAMHLHLVVSA